MPLTPKLLIIVLLCLLCFRVFIKKNVNYLLVSTCSIRYNCQRVTKVFVRGTWALLISSFAKINVQQRTYQALTHLPFYSGCICSITSQCVPFLKFVVFHVTNIHLWRRIHSQVKRFRLSFQMWLGLCWSHDVPTCLLCLHVCLGSQRFSFIRQQTSLFSIFLFLFAIFNLFKSLLTCHRVTTQISVSVS